MDSQKLIDTLLDLKENRRLSSESEAILKPFVGEKDSLPFIFLESSSTFSSRLDEKYSKGKTVLAKLADSELECTILFPPSENEWVEGLSKEDAFVSNVKVLALDNLYQRVVFGFLTEEIGAGEEPQNFENIPTGEEEISEQVEKNDFTNQAEDNSGDDKIQVEESKQDQADIKDDLLDVLSEREEILSEKIEEDITEVQKTESIPEPDIPKQPNPNGLKISNTEKKSKVIKINQETSEEETNEPEPPPPIPSLDVQKKAKEIDFRELERIRDKRYEKGVQSLTKEEKEILGLSKIKLNKPKLKLPPEIKRQKHKKIADDQSDMASMGCRGVFGVIVGLFSLSFLAKGWIVLSIIGFGISWVLLAPIIEMFNKNFSK